MSYVWIRFHYSGQQNLIFHPHYTAPLNLRISSSHILELFFQKTVQAYEVDKKVNDTKSRLEKSYLETNSQQRILQAIEKAESEKLRQELQQQVANLTTKQKQ